MHTDDEGTMGCMPQQHHVDVFAHVLKEGDLFLFYSCPFRFSLELACASFIGVTLPACGLQLASLLHSLQAVCPA